LWPGRQVFLDFLGFLQKKKVVRKAKSSIMATRKKQKGGRLSNDKNVVKLPAFPSFRVWAFWGLYNPNNLHNFFVKSLMPIPGSSENCEMKRVQQTTIQN
jgi:hypothetical protein